MNTRAKIDNPAENLPFGAIICAIALVVTIVIAHRNSELALFFTTVCYFIYFLVAGRKNRLGMVELAVGVILLYEWCIVSSSIYPLNSFLTLTYIHLPLIVLLFTYRSFAKERNLRILGVVLLSVAFLLAASTIIQYQITWARLTLDEMVSIENLKVYFIPFGKTNNEWVTLILCFIALPVWMALGHRRLNWLFWVCILISGLLNLAVLSSYSRGAYLALIFFYGLVLLHIIFGKENSRYLFRYLIFTVLLTVLLAIPQRKPLLETLGMHSNVSQVRSTQGRISMLQETKCLMTGHEWVGVGGQNFPIIADYCGGDSEDFSLTSFPVNTYHQILIEKGILGILIYLGFFAIVSVLFFRLWRTQPERLILYFGVLAFLVRELFFSTFFQSSIVGTTFAILLGAAIAGRQWPVTRMRGWQWVIAIGIVLAVGVMYWKNKEIVQGVEKMRRIDVDQDSSAVQRLWSVFEEYPMLGSHQYEEAGLEIGQTVWSERQIGNWLADTSVVCDVIPTDALSFFTRALRENPYEATHMFQVGWFHFANCDLPAAESAFRAALTIEPQNPMLHLSLGMVLEKFGDPEGAMEAYLAAIRRAPTLLDSQFLIDLKNRLPDRSETILPRLIGEMEPLSEENNPIINARYGKILINAGRWEKAGEILRQVSLQLPNANRVWYNLATVELQAGDTTTALDYLNRSYRLDNLDIPTNIALGKLHARDSLHDIRQVEKALYHLGDALGWQLRERTAHHLEMSMKYNFRHRFRNDYLLTGMKNYTTSKVDFKEICLDISHLLRLKGDVAKADRMLEVAEMDPVADEVSLDEFRF